MLVLNVNICNVFDVGYAKRVFVNKVTIQSMPPIATGDISIELRSITDLVELLVWQFYEPVHWPSHSPFLLFRDLRACL